MELVRLPVFPLNTVLFPGARLQLQIFEQRYLNMVKNCMKDDSGFVIVLISDGNEVGEAPDIFSTGTHAEIVDWGQMDNGLLSITVEARHRVSILKTEPDEQKLLWGDIKALKEMPAEIDASEVLIDLLNVLAEHPYLEERKIRVDTSDINAVIWCLADLLPFPNMKKQHLLALSDPNKRLSTFEQMLSELDEPDRSDH